MNKFLITLLQVFLIRDIGKADEFGTYLVQYLAIYQFIHQLVTVITFALKLLLISLNI